MALDIGTDGCGRGIRIHGRFERALPSEGIVSHSRIRPLCAALAANRHSFRKVFKLNDNKNGEKNKSKEIFMTDGWVQSQHPRYDALQGRHSLRIGWRRLSGQVSNRMSPIYRSTVDHDQSYPPATQSTAATLSVDQRSIF